MRLRSRASRRVSISSAFSRSLLGSRPTFQQTAGHPPEAYAKGKSTASFLRWYELASVVEAQGPHAH